MYSGYIARANKHTERIKCLQAALQLGFLPERILVEVRVVPPIPIHPIHPIHHESCRVAEGKGVATIKA